MQQIKGLKNFPKVKLSDVILPAFFLSRLIALLFSFPNITDIFNYQSHFTHNQIDHLAVYSQFAFEYPPLALMLINLAGWVANDATSITPYYLSFALLMIIVDFSCLKACQFYCENRLKMNKNEVTYVSLLYCFFGLLLFSLLYHRLDLGIALFFTLSLIFFNGAKPKLTTSFYANALAGFFYKFLPVINVPVAIIGKARSFKEIMLNSLIFFIALTSMIFALEIYTQHNFIKNMMYHQNRGIHVESIFGSFLLFKNLVSGKISEILNNYGSWNITSNPQFENFTRIIGSLALLGFYAALFIKKIRLSDEKFLEATLITILIFCSFQRVLSPQFFIWLMPIISIWLAKNRDPRFLLVFSLLFLATAIIFFVGYFAMLNQEPYMVSTLFIRNMILVGLTIFLTIRFFKNAAK